MRRRVFRLATAHPTDTSALSALVAGDNSRASIWGPGVYLRLGRLFSGMYGLGESG
jgi:hypothetical protein